MLHNVKQLTKLAVHATDGEIGTVRDALFDDEHWVVRYLVVDTGGWMTGREVLLSPISVTALDREHGKVHVNLTRERVQNSPGIASHQPISRRHETALFHHYGYPYYWGGPYAWGYAVFPALMEQQLFEDPERLDARKEMEEAGAEEQHLRSCGEVMDYWIAAGQEKFGHVVDFLFDEEDWSVQYMVVDPRNWWPGKHVLIPASRIEQVYWADKEVLLDMQRADIEKSPEYDPDNLPAPLARPVSGPVGQGATSAPRR